MATERAAMAIAQSVLAAAPDGQYVRWHDASKLWVPRTAAETRVDLGLAIGTDVQAYDADLAEIAARGPCESVGCHPGDRCPVFHREVSDHCPVTATW